MAETKDQVKKEKKEKKPKFSYRKERKRLLAALAQADPGSKEFNEIAKNLKELEACNQIKHARSITGDGIAKCATHTVTTGMLMMFECENPIRTKLLSFIPKLIR